MRTVYERHGVTWVDLESPTHEELAEVAVAYGLSPLTVQELSGRTDRPKIDLYDNFIYLVLHFPTPGHSHGGTISEEIDFVVGKQFLVTVHYEPVDVLREVTGALEVDVLLDRGSNNRHAGFIFFTLIEQLYGSLEDRLQSIAHDLDVAKRRIFAGDERAMVERLSSISRILLEFRIAIQAHGAIWESFEKAGASFFDKKFSYYLTSISGGYTKIWNMLEGNKEILSDLRQTNDSLLNTKMNETMLRLTTMAFVVFPLSLIAALFSMSTHTTPIVGSDYDFWKIILIMACVALTIFSFFKHKKWL